MNSINNDSHVTVGDSGRNALGEGAWLDQVSWNSDGLVTAIAQDYDTGVVLMLAWMNRDALLQTCIRREAVYWSRSRSRLWHKGESSGHVQSVREIRLDCDADAVLLRVNQRGGIACHTGREHCFYQRLQTVGDTVQWHSVDAVLKDPAAIYKTKESGEKQ